MTTCDKCGQPLERIDCPRRSGDGDCYAGKPEGCPDGWPKPAPEVGGLCGYHRCPRFALVRLADLRGEKE